MILIILDHVYQRGNGEQHRLYEYEDSIMVQRAMLNLFQLILITETTDTRR